MRLSQCLLSEEFVAKNNWLRSPQNRQNVGDISAELEQRRQDAFRSTADEFRVDADKLKHELQVAQDIAGLETAMEKFNCDAYDIAADTTEFEQAVERDDLESARRQLQMGLDRWINDQLMGAEQNGNDVYSLQGHPLRDVKSGSPSLKRSMGY